MFRAVVEARELSNEGKVIVEDYIFGRHFSCECISQNGQHHILAYTKRDNAENLSGFIEHIHGEPASLTDNQKKRIDEYIIKILNICNITTGASSVEFLLGSKEEIVALEITPSMYGDFIGTNLVELSTGYDYMKMAIDAACGKDLHFDISPANNDVKVQIILTKQDLKKLSDLREHAPEKVLKYKLFKEEREVPDRINEVRYGYFIYQR